MNTTKKKKTVKKTASRKKVLNLKNRAVYALAMRQGGELYTITGGKAHANHAVNSYLAHGGEEKDLKNTVIVKMIVVGAPTVKTVRTIKIK